MSSSDEAAVAVFQWLVSKARFVVAAGLFGVLIGASFLPHLVKDVRPDAFLASDNPALVYRNIVKELFGLIDPIVIALVDARSEGIYTPENLHFIQWLSDEVAALPNVNSARLVSLATENNISSTIDGLEITPFLETLPGSVVEAAAVRLQVENFPLYTGSLVSRDGHATVVVAEMANEDLAEGSYQNVLTLLDDAPIPNGLEVHVAGEGAVSGYLGSYIDADAQRLVPVAGLIITLILVLAYRRISPALLCVFVMLATIVITLGVMAAQGVSFYIITSALPVILIGISVADAIHIYSHYFDLQEQEPQRDCKSLVVATMQAMWRPVSLTSITTIAGFLGLYFAAQMPPFQYFGLYAAFGVGVAWVYSLLFLPAAMILTRPQFAQRNGGESGGFMSAVGRFTLRNSGLIIVVFMATSALGVYSAMQLQVDDDPIGIFHPDEPIAIADQTINHYTNGSSTLDVVVETLATEELFDPSKLRKVEALQNYAASLPHVGGSVSIVDYLKQMNRALNDDAPSFYRLPETREMVAQYFLIYAALSDPTDFEEEVDYDYRLANIRISLTAGGYQATMPVIKALEKYIQEQFNGPDMTATLSGRVNLNYHWIKELADSHFTGMLVALVLVWGVSAMLFRSELAGLYTLVPVAGSVLGVYAVMVLMGVTLGMGTSMFAAIAIGLGIDFAIHTLDRLKVLMHRHKGNMAAAFSDFYPTTGRALLFNFLAIACGFAVLLASNIMSLVNFGGIVMLSIGISFVASMTLLPALVWRLQPRFLCPRRAVQSRFTIPRIIALAVAAMAVIFVLFSPGAKAQEQLSADDIVQRINQVDQAEHVTRRLSMEMIDRHGKSRQRETIGYRRYFGDEKKTVMFYLSPANVRDTAFLTWDYAQADREDDQWLYLPALRKVRRISVGDRGDYFLGTDFTYEDIKQDGKLSTADFNYSLSTAPPELGPEPGDFDHIYLESLPRTDKIGKELGYSRTVVIVDAQNWIVRGVEFWDLKGKHLKSLKASDVREVQGIWTRHVLTMVNHQTGHTTKLMSSEVDYLSAVEANLFTRQALQRGH